jgi:hypothetical protein
MGPELMAMPWERPLEEWPARVLAVVRDRGISRHVVRFVRTEDALFAVKELPDLLVERERRLLGHLGVQSVPVVEVAGTVVGRGQLDGLLVTRFLDFSIPYRVLFADEPVRAVVGPLLDALVTLLIRLHTVGFFWGDCSLSNTLFRRDAGELAAYLVDAETGELQDSLTPGQRGYDLELAKESVAGELYDLAAGRETLPDEGWELDPAWVAEEVGRLYHALWAELTREELIRSDEHFRVEQRIRKINELGFDVAEVSLVPADGGSRLRLFPRVVEPGHHRRALAALTGLDVGENQARRLLNDLSGYRAWLARAKGQELPMATAAHRWLDEVFQRAVQAVPPELAHKLEPAELFHQYLEHRWFLSEAAGRDVGADYAMRSFVANILPYLPDQREFLDVLTEEAGPPAGSASAGAF